MVYRPPPPKTWRPRAPQEGVFILTVVMALLFLLGFMGIALDLGRLFVIRAELQTALDGCALAAARELDETSSALSRARAAGLRAGNLNRVNFQSASWAGQPLLSEASISFRDQNNGDTSDATRARYARCAHQHASVGAWLLPALDAFLGRTLTAGLRQVSASAMATRASAQSACPLPVGLRPRVEDTPPNYGLAKGDWITLLAKAGVAPKGQMGWANLDGSGNALETERELRGYCGTRVGDKLGTPGVQTGVADAWNARFGIYKNKETPSLSNAPDVTGYAYTSLNWPSQRNAYEGPPTSGKGADPSGTAENYKAKAAKYASCGDTSNKLSDCLKITGLKIQGGFKDLAAPGLDPDLLLGGHYAYGGKNRRIVTAPIVNASNQVVDFACMLMLQPLSVPVVDVQLEFIGNASAAGSPCTTGGLPGGAAGPLVPVLVR